MRYLKEMLDLLGEDITNTRFSDSKYRGQFSKADRMTSTELGRGSFSKVMADRDPHMVRKQSIRPMGRGAEDLADGFDAFVQMLIDEGLMDNIHFPKVYKAHRSHDVTGQHKSKYVIEKLERFGTNLRRDEIAQIEETHMVPGYDEDYSMTDRIYDSCRSAKARERYIRMDSLKEACAALEHMAATSDFRLDIHGQNIMVRRTPHGLQLVLADPFGVLKSSALPKYQ